MERVVEAILKADRPLLELCDGRITPIIRPGNSGLPAVTYTLSKYEPEYSLSQKKNVNLHFSQYDIRGFANLRESTQGFDKILLLSEYIANVIGSAGKNEKIAREMNIGLQRIKFINEQHGVEDDEASRPIGVVRIQIEAVWSFL